VAAPALRLMLQQRLAELAGVSRNELEGLIPVKLTVKPAASLATRPRPSRKPPSLARKLLQLLLFQPELGAEFDVSLLGEGSEELKTLSALLGLAAGDRSQPTTVAVLERFRGTSHEALLSEVSGEILQWDEEFEVAEEFAGALEQLKRSARQRRIESLLALSRVQGLSPEEKRELQHLLQGGSTSTKNGQSA
jgi:DNA primase